LSWGFQSCFPFGTCSRARRLRPTSRSSSDRNISVNFIAHTSRQATWCQDRAAVCAAGSQGLSSELISHPVDGEDVLGMAGIGLDLLAKPCDVDVDSTRGGHRVIAPD